MAEQRTTTTSTTSTTSTTTIVIGEINGGNQTFGPNQPIVNGGGKK